MAEKKATAPTVARTNTKRAESYHKGDSRSSLKIEIGEILFCLLTGQQDKDDWWQIFEQLLRRYYALKRLTRASL